jgi:hypothetical protein
VRTLKGARKDTLDLIAKVTGGRLVRDLVFLPPNSAIDRRLRVPIAETNERHRDHRSGSRWSHAVTATRTCRYRSATARRELAF